MHQVEIELSTDELEERIKVDYKKRTGMELAPVFAEVIANSVFDLLVEKGLFVEEEEDLFND